MEISLSHDGLLRLHTSERTYVDIAPTEAGARALVRLLRENQQWPKAKIGERGFPTQWEIDKWLATEGRRKREAKAAATAEQQAAALQDKYGFDIRNLEIDL